MHHQKAPTRKQLVVIVLMTTALSMSPTTTLPLPLKVLPLVGCPTQTCFAVVQVKSTLQLRITKSRSSCAWQFDLSCPNFVLLTSIHHRQPVLPGTRRCSRQPLFISGTVALESNLHTSLTTMRKFGNALKADEDYCPTLGRIVCPDLYSLEPH